MTDARSTLTNYNKGNTMNALRLSALQPRVILSSSLMVFAQLAPVQAQTTETWSVGASGLWNVAGNWSPNGVPNNGGGNTYNVDIVDGVSTVTLNLAATINDLTMGTGNTLVIPTGQQLTVAGPSISNAGAIQVNGGGGNSAYLVLDGNSTLSGAGTLTLSVASGGGSSYIQQGTGGVTLTSSSTIQGAGTIGNGGLAVANSGTIDANAAGGLLLNGSGGITNTGLLEATKGDTLTINTSVTDTGGTIKAAGAGSDVVLSSASITGGTLTASGGGVLTPSGTVSLNNVTLSGGTVYPIATGTQTDLSGTFANNGSVAMSGGNGNNAFLVLENSLTNAGPVTLSVASGGGSSYIQQGTGGVTLTNSGTIQGAGIIGNGGLAVANSGTIDANAAGGLLLNGSGGITNTGLLEATGGNTLTINTSVTNTGANITASGAGSDVVLSSANITGGTLTASGGGVLTPIGTVNLTNVTISSGTVYPIATGTQTDLSGTFTNNGSVAMSGGNGNNAFLVLENSLTNAGPVTMSVNPTGGGSSYIQQGTGGVTLTNSGTIQGAGIIGNGGLAVANSGTIDASAAGGLLLNGSGGITNTGLLEATGGNTLTINTSVTNTGANITASGAGSDVVLSSASITGGTLTASGGGVLTPSGTVSLNNVTLSGGTVYPIATGTQTDLSGTFANNGSVAMSGGNGNNAFLVLENSLTNAGPVTLSVASGGGSSYIQQGTGGVTLTNTGTIQGAGVIGNGGLTVVNGATGTIGSVGAGATLLVNGSGGLTNSGTLLAGAGSTLHVSSGAFSNFAGTTLTGGTYNLAGGTLQIDELGSTGGEIVTNAANIVLSAPGYAFLDSAGMNALSALATTAAKSSFTLAGGANFTTGGNYHNLGTLTVGAGSTFDVAGKFTNYSGTTTTLKGGTYNLTGTLGFSGANVVTNAAKLTLIGSSAEILNTKTNKNGLANFSTNSSTGTLSLQGGANLTTVGSVSNAGTLTIGTGSTLTEGGAGTFTQTAGTTTDSGTVAASGGVTLSGGSLFGTGTISGNVQSSATVTPGATAAGTGTLTDTGTYTQNAGGTLDINIASKKAFDVFSSAGAVLSGTLNITDLKSFVPTVGSTFKILTFGSETGTFAAVNGLSINGSEHYTVTYQPTDVLLTVVAGPSPAASIRAGAEPASAKLTGSVTDSARLAATLARFNAAYAEAGMHDMHPGITAVALRRPAVQRARALELINQIGKQRR